MDTDRDFRLINVEFPVSILSEKITFKGPKIKINACSLREIEKICFSTKKTQIISPKIKVSLGVLIFKYFQNPLDWKSSLLPINQLFSKKYIFFMQSSRREDACFIGDPQNSCIWEAIFTDTVHTKLSFTVLTRLSGSENFEIFFHFSLDPKNRTFFCAPISYLNKRRFMCKS